MLGSWSATISWLNRIHLINQLPASLTCLSICLPFPLIANWAHDHVSNVPCFKRVGWPTPRPPILHTTSHWARHQWLLQPGICMHDGCVSLCTVASCLHDHVCDACVWSWCLDSTCALYLDGSLSNAICSRDCWSIEVPKSHLGSLQSGLKRASCLIKPTFRHEIQVKSPVSVTCMHEVGSLHLTPLLIGLFWHLCCYRAGCWPCGEAGSASGIPVFSETTLCWGFPVCFLPETMWTDSVTHFLCFRSKPRLVCLVCSALASCMLWYIENGQPEASVCKNVQRRTYGPDSFCVLGG